MLLELEEIHIISQPLTMPTLHDCKAQVRIFLEFGEIHIIKRIFFTILLG